MPAGRPLKFETPEEIENLATTYFKKCDAKKQFYTITGLALALDTDRVTLCEYAKRPEFTNTIKKIKNKVIAQVELLTLNKGHSGAIFWMKNFGWTDKQEIHHSTDMDLKALLGNTNQKD